MRGGMIRQAWRGLRDRLEGFREGRAEDFNGVPAEQFVRELTAAPAADDRFIDLRGEPLAPLELSAPGVMMPAPSPRGRHRTPGPVTVTFPCVTATIARAVPECGTRPPWDTAEFAAVPDEPVFTAPVPDIDPGEFEAGLDAALSGASSAVSTDEPAREADDLQEYLDGLPRYPDD